MRHWSPQKSHLGISWHGQAGRRAGRLPQALNNPKVRNGPKAVRSEATESKPQNQSNSTPINSVTSTHCSEAWRHMETECNLSKEWKSRSFIAVCSSRKIWLTKSQSLQRTM